MEVLTSFDRERIEELRGRDEFFWLDLRSPTEADVQALGELFGWHPLAVEDTRNFGQRPKLDDYGSDVFLVYYGVEGDAKDQPKLIEVHLYISGSYVITFRHRHCGELDAVQKLLEQREVDSEEAVIYRILDGLTDTYFPYLASIDDEIDELEDSIISGPTDEQLQRLFQLKRSLVVLRRIVTPERDLFARTIDDISALPGLTTDSRDYFRDIYDHLIRISDLVDSYRDLLTGAMDVYLSTVSNRLNVVMKQLTIIATIFLPLTVVTGFFGQNFKWLVDNIDTFAAFLGFGVGSMVASCVILYVWFKRSGFLSGADGAP
jgi:magnesium transporter